MTLDSSASRQDEDERIARLRAYGVLDPDRALPALDELVRRAQEVAAFPMAWLSFFDGKRERLRARSGISTAYLSRDQLEPFLKTVASLGRQLYALHNALKERA
jgi:hypothetical protein